MAPRTQRKQEQQPPEQVENVAGFFEKAAPQDLEAERSVLGAILLLNDAFDDVVTHLPTEDRFYADAHKRIFKAIRVMREKGKKAIDAVTLAASLNKSGDLEQVGGPDYLLRILEAVPHAAHAEYYAKIVKGMWMQRSLIETCSQGLRKAFTSGEDAEDIINEVERSIFALREGFSDETVTQRVDDIVRDTMERMFKRMDGTELGIKTGFPLLDEPTGGFHDGEVVVLAARPSMGKTALLCNLVVNAIVLENRRPLVFSIEQGKLDLVERMLAIKAGINSHALRNGRVDDPVLQANLEKAFNEFQNWPLWIDDFHKKASSIAAVARRMHRKHGCNFIVIDYLQLMEPEDRRVPREQQIAEMSRTIKWLGQELKCPVLLLAQINRDVEKESRKPRLSDLRESGSIEQDADQVWFIHRQEQFRPGERPGEADIIIAKNRNGPIGEVTLAWHKETLTFANAEARLPYADTEFSEGEGHPSGDDFK
jgi:replicative DNA helicase